MADALYVGDGTRLLFEGEPCTVIGFDGRTVTLRGDVDRRVRSVSILEVAAHGRELPAGGGRDGQEQDLAGAMAPREALGQAALCAEHAREVLTGFRSGDPSRPAVGEPRELFAAEVPMMQRYAHKAAEVGVSARTVERWVEALRSGRTAELADERSTPRRRWSVDPRWDAALEAVVAGRVGASTPGTSALIRWTRERLEQQFGPGVVPLPSTATAYRRIKMLTKGKNATTGSAKGRRSIDDRPDGPYGRLVATRPGEYLILDTQDLDVFAMEAATGRWVRAQLTIAQDLNTRGIAGLRVTPASTKAVDVAGVLFEAFASPIIASGAALPGSPARHPRGLYVGVPEHVVFDEVALEGGGTCIPETIVVDHGKVFLSEHVLGACDRLGTSVQPAIAHKPTDKPTCERFFKTLREGLIQFLPAYTGPDVYSRGVDLEAQAFLYLHELEDVIRDWVATVYHVRAHDGLAMSAYPGQAWSPKEMLEIGSATVGGLRVPRDPARVFEFLAVQWRTIQHYGVQVGGLRYDAGVLEAYRDTVSPYGGKARGKWPVRVNPDDVRYVFFQDPADNSWHALEWEHARLIGVPFSAEAMAYARRFVAAQGRHVDADDALSELLTRWSTGEVLGRRERRIAARLAAERTALPAVEADPGLAESVARLALVPQPVAGDDDEEDELTADVDLPASPRTFEVLR